MLNKVSAFISQYHMMKPGDRIVCALSGGADSVALLWALYLLQDKWQFTLSAAHFNHQLRGAESDRDQAFVEELCRRYDIPLTVGTSPVASGKKGLEAAAREARYAFFATLPGKIATAHTADDNAETVLMHLVRGTGLKGLGGISPVREQVIRPMLTVTRQEVLQFLEEYCLPHIEDSSNHTDAFLRNRIRHNVMPLLSLENPSLGENLSQMALRLRQDEAFISSMVEQPLPDVFQLRQMPESLRCRHLVAFLEDCGVKEPEKEHISLVEKLVVSDKPSAKATFPGGVVICRNYERLEKQEQTAQLVTRVLPCPGSVEIPECGIRICCQKADIPLLQWSHFTVSTVGDVVIRSRQAGDTITLNGGTKSLKKLYADRKIPAGQRQNIPVLADRNGVLAVWGIGANLDRTSGGGDLTEIWFEDM